MDYLKLIIFDGILGYVLQATSYMAAQYAFGRRKVTLKNFSLMVLLATVLLLIIRNIPMISFGLHTLLFMIVVILLGTFVIKIPISKSVLAVLATAVIVIASEGGLFALLNNIFSTEALEQFMSGATTFSFLKVNNNTLQGQINTAFLGFPTNLVLGTVVWLIYFINMKLLSKRKHKNGETCKADS